MRLRLPLLAFVLALAAFIHWTPNLDRPLEQDELVSMKASTAFEYETTAEESRSAPKFDLRRIPKGWAKSFLNPWSPNNHFCHSWLVSVSEGFFGFSERACRLPAMMAAVVLAGAIFWVGCARTGDALLSTCLAGVVIVHPYFLQYAQTARGYTLEALLVTLQVYLIHENTRRPAWWLHVLGAFLSICVFVNLVTSFVMWLVPLYGVLFLVSRERRLVLLEALAVFAVCGTFIGAHLGAFLESQSKYGIPLAQATASAPELLWRYLAPGAWGILPALGIAGWVVGFYRKEWFSRVALAAALMTTAYIVVTKKLPYERSFGLFLVLLLIGAMDLFRNLAGSRWRLVVPVAVLVPVLLAAPSAASYRSEPGYSDTFAATAAHVKQKGPGAPAMIVLPWIFGEESRYYLPPVGVRTSPANLEGEIIVYLPCAIDDGRTAFRTQYADRAARELEYWKPPLEWNQFTAWEQSNLRLLAVPMVLQSGFPPPETRSSAGFCIWEPADPYFDFHRFVRDGLKKGEGPWALKMSAFKFLQPGQVIIFFSDHAEFESAKELMTDISQRAGGRVATALPR